MIIVLRLSNVFTPIIVHHCFHLQIHVFYIDFQLGGVVEISKQLSIKEVKSEYPLSQEEIDQVRDHLKMSRVSPNAPVKNFKTPPGSYFDGAKPSQN